MTTTSPRPIIVTGRLPGAGSLLPVATGLVSAAAVAIGVLEARLPLGPGNTAVHHGYPFFAVGMALVFTAVGRWVGGRASRWPLLSQVVGLAYAVNALLIGLLAYTVTPCFTVMSWAGGQPVAFHSGPAGRRTDVRAVVAADRRDPRTPSSGRPRCKRNWRALGRR